MLATGNAAGDASGDGSVWRVFRNNERDTHVVLRDTEENPGHSLVFTSRSFAECMAFVNGPKVDQPGQRYWVFRLVETGTLLVRRSEESSDQLSRVYGPDSFQKCVEWARRNSRCAPRASQSSQRNVPQVKKHETGRPAAARAKTKRTAKQRRPAKSETSQ
jgi:hypothetical protein